MFDKSVVGLVSATATGWGKVGSGVSYLLIPVIYWSLHTYNNTEWSWRLSQIVAPILVLFVSVATWFLSDTHPDKEK